MADFPKLAKEAIAEAKRTGATAMIVDSAGHLQLDEDVTDELNELQAKEAVSEAVRRFVVLPVRWTEAGGQLTPSLKLRRDAVVRQHRSEIEALFGF